jgi:limonene-1,2-epoxide hydrolase
MPRAKEAPMTPTETVHEFIHAVEAKDLNRAMALCHDDIEYDNVPIPTVRGVAAVRSFLEGFLASLDEMEWVIHRELEVGAVVVNERTDRFRAGGNWIELPVAGFFEVLEGKIALWRDYFDLQTMASQMPQPG